MDDKIIKTENEVAILDNSPNGLISQALAQSLPIEYLERLMALQERWEKNQAKKAFDEAMSKFQSKCPIIKKTKNGARTKSGTIISKYAPIEKIVEQTKDLISECGFSYLVKTPAFTVVSVEVSVEVRHKLGHSEISTVTFPLISKTGDIMSAPQVVAGSVTFAKRYAFCNAFGIMTMDEDKDGQQPQEKKEEIPDPQEKIDWGKLIQNCQTLKELNAVWKRMSEKEQAEHKASFTKIKTFIESETKKAK
jgi:hypothetical protein